MRLTWRILAKALGEKASKHNHEADQIAAIRVWILMAYMVTNFFICAGVIRHWNDAYLLSHHVDSQSGSCHTRCGETDRSDGEG